MAEYSRLNYTAREINNYLANMIDYNDLVDDLKNRQLPEVLNQVTTLQSAVDEMQSFTFQPAEDLYTRLDSAESNITDLTTRVTTNEQNIASEELSRTESDSILQTNIDNVNTALSEEATAREAKDTELETAINNEIEARLQSDTNISNLTTLLDSKGIVWSENTPIKKGALVSYDGVIYSALHELTPEENTTPPMNNSKYVELTEKQIDAYTKEEVDALLKPINDKSIAETDKDNNWTSLQTFKGNIIVQGDLIQEGNAYETHVEVVKTNQDMIVLRENAVSGLPAGSYVGLIAKKYNGRDDGYLVYDTEGARVGKLDETEPLLTRDEKRNMSHGAPLVWDAVNSRAVSGAFPAFPAFHTVKMDVTYEDDTTESFNVMVLDE